MTIKAIDYTTPSEFCSYFSLSNQHTIQMGSHLLLKTDDKESLIQIDLLKNETLNEPMISRCQQLIARILNDALLLKGKRISAIQTESTYNVTADVKNGILELEANQFPIVLTVDRIQLVSRIDRLIQKIFGSREMELQLVEDQRLFLTGIDAFSRQKILENDLDSLYNVFYPHVPNGYQLLLSFKDLVLAPGKIVETEEPALVLFSENPWSIQIHKV